MKNQFFNGLSYYLNVIFYFFCQNDIYINKEKARIEQWTFTAHMSRITLRDLF